MRSSCARAPGGAVRPQIRIALGRSRGGGSTRAMDHLLLRTARPEVLDAHERERELGEALQVEEGREASAQESLSHAPAPRATHARRGARLRASPQPRGRCARGPFDRQLDRHEPDAVERGIGRLVTDERVDFVEEGCVRVVLAGARRRRILDLLGKEGNCWARDGRAPGRCVLLDCRRFPAAASPARARDTRVLWTQRS